MLKNSSHNLNSELAWASFGQLLGQLVFAKNHFSLAASQNGSYIGFLRHEGPQANLWCPTGLCLLRQPGLEHLTSPSDKACAASPPLAMACVNHL